MGHRKSSSSEDGTINCFSLCQSVLLESLNSGSHFADLLAVLYLHGGPTHGRIAKEWRPVCDDEHWQGNSDTSMH
jgi:hypothetical protein